jgi:hypothetical protein
VIADDRAAIERSLCHWADVERCEALLEALPHALALLAGATPNHIGVGHDG